MHRACTKPLGNRRRAPSSAANWFCRNLGEPQWRRVVGRSVNEGDRSSVDVATTHPGEAANEFWTWPKLTNGMWFSIENKDFLGAHGANPRQQK